MKLTDSISISRPVCGPLCKAQLANMPKAGLWEQFKTFFGNIFNTSDWPARWHCGTWSDLHGWLYIFSDLLIWATYFTIPVLLIILIKKRKDFPFHSIIWLFVAFIVLCGLTHFVDAAMFWWPAYRFSALLRLLTGLVSLTTVYALYRIIPLVNMLRTVKDLEREINDREVVEEKLAASEFLLSEAGRMGNVGGWERNLIDHKITWSKTVYDIHELPYDHDLALDEAYAYYTEEYRPVLKQAVNECLTQGNSFDLEMQIITAKGKTVWVRVYGEALTDADGTPYKLRGVFMDIDRYKINELSLSKSVELVSQHNKQLKTFNHILSHNIRNHSSNLSLVTSLIDPNTLDADNADLVDKIKKISVSLNNTLNDLSDAIRIREANLSSEELEFEVVIKQVLEIINSLVKSSQAQISYDLAVKSVTFPKVYLESVILNLLTNAIKYKKENEHPVITLKTYTDQQGKTILECTDNGSGIDLQLHGNKIFGLYKTFHDRKDAHGVGLFLIKTQVESQGGDILVESAPNVGSTFKIIFNDKN